MKAMLPDGHAGKINNLTGVNDPYETPQNPDLVINTGIENEEASIKILFDLIMQKINS